MQYVYTLTGVIHPERADVEVSHTTIDYQGNDAEIGFSIYKSKIAFSYKSKNPLSDKMLSSIHYFAEEQIRVVTDSLGFLIGCGYDVEISQLIDHKDNLHRVYGVQEEYLESLGLIEKHSPQDLLSIHNSDPRAGACLRRSLSDLRMAIRNAKDYPFYCYRAIECLTYYFSDGNNKSQAWDSLRNKLGIDKDIIMDIKNSADPVRHGDPFEKAGANRESLMTSAWSIVDSFVTHLKPKEESSSNAKHGDH